MSDVNPIWLEGQRKYWQRHDWQRFIRHDAHRFMKPEPARTKSHAERLIEQRQAEEEQAVAAAEQDAFEREVWALRHDFAKLKLEYELRRFQRKYSPNQPRVPAGNPDGGQWSSGGGAGAGDSVRVSVVDPRDSAGLVISDTTPDGVRAWAQYAETADQKSRDDAAIARTTVTLHNTVVQVSGAVVRRPDISPREFGTEVHVAFARTVRALDLPGIGTSGVEQSFDKDGEARYGKDGSIRTDVILRNEKDDIIAIYDLKTGNAIIRPSRAEELRAMTGAALDVPVIELHSTRGPARR